MPWQHRGPNGPMNRSEDGRVGVVRLTRPEPLFSLIDDDLDGRTVPGAHSPCDCIGRRTDTDEIRRLIATARATLARAGKVQL
jgi:hypothetical protein